jgi:hypothetical protein
MATLCQFEVHAEASVSLTGIWSSTITSDDMQGTRKTSTLADLRKSGARLSDNIRHAFQRVLSLPFCSAQAIRDRIELLEECGIDFGLRVRACARNGATLNAECGCISTSITGLENCQSRLQRGCLDLQRRKLCREQKRVVKPQELLERFWRAF